MKIGIITLYGYTNYGNRLQNYAVQELLKSRNIEVETLVYYPQFYERIIKNIAKLVCAVAGNSENIRFQKFFLFSKRYIKCRYIASINKLKKIEHEYDYFIVGSDQVWNPNLRRKERDFFFLKFTKPEKRLCISPSFGVNKLEQKDIAFYEKALKGFEKLSSRELDGVEIIKQLTQRKAVHLIDPTLAIEKEQWNKIIRFCEWPKNSYLIKAFLGNVTKEREKEIEAFAGKNHLDVIDIFDKNGRYYTIAPDSFLYLVKNATHICTDSFHCTAFAINFNIPFYVFERLNNDLASDGTFSRLTSLLEKFRMEKYYLQDLSEVTLDYDFAEANKVLAIERAVVQNYLDEIILENS